MIKKYVDIQKEGTDLLYKLNINCRMCDSNNLIEYLDLGFTPPADQFRTKEELFLPEISYPLRVNLCKKCGLSQLSHTVNPSVLFQYDYLYESSTTKTGQKHWDEFSRKVVDRLELSPKSLVVDIGSNDGTLLKFFKEKGMRVIGVDPAPNIVKIANEKNKIKTICDFFNSSVVKKIRQEAGQADVITGTNVFAHIDDLNSLMKAVKSLLTNTGVFIFESPYFQNLINQLQYDTIYHEHLSYLSLKPLIPFFAKFGMEVFAVEESSIHGGSFRVYVGKKNIRPIDSSVFKIIKQEKKNRLHEVDTMNEFTARVYGNRKKLNRLVDGLIHKGKKIAAVSAPAKGMTLLNFCGLTNRQLMFVSEKSRLKINRYTPGGHIPIISDKDFIKMKPDYALLLAWNFSKEIMSNLKEFSDNGGRFIIPIPEPKII